MHKLQTQGLHHITLVGADRQTSIDFWEGVLGMPFIFEQPNLDNAGESHLYFDPGDGRLITVFTQEDRKPARRAPRPTPAACITSRSTCRAPSSCRRSSGSARAASRTPACATGYLRRHLFRGSARAPDRALVLEIRRARRFHPLRRAVCRPQFARRARRPRDHGSPHRRRDRGSRQVVDQEPVGRPIAQGPLSAQPRA